MKKILDNSVISKWFLKEPGSTHALSYLQDFTDGKFTIIVPTLFFYELGNVFWKNKILPEKISKIMQKFQSFSDDYFIREDVGFMSFRNIYQIAQDYNITYYDAVYVVLMQKYDCEFVTADVKLHDKLKTAFAHIKLLK